MPAPTEDTKYRAIVVGEQQLTAPGPVAERRLVPRGKQVAAAVVERRAQTAQQEREKRTQNFLREMFKKSADQIRASVQKATGASESVSAARMTNLGTQMMAFLGKGTPGGEMPGGILGIAKSQVGAPYVWAAMNPKGPTGGKGSAFDCSGFTKWVLGQVGVNVPHMASEQQKVLPFVTRNGLQPGDLLFFNFGRKAPGVADHVGIYLGNGMMIDASSSAGRILIRPVMWSNFIGGGAVRI